MKRLVQQWQNGSVSLFVVIFAALLIITIGVAFMRIMIQGQMQTTANDLSKSALDSANAGVEDVKRAIAEYTKLKCSTAEPVDGTTCNTLQRALFSGGSLVSSSWSNGCYATIAAKVATPKDKNATEGEVQVGDDPSLEQAYTCTKVRMNTEDYEGTLIRDESRVIPLKSLSDSGVDKPFNTVVIKWFSQANLRGAQVTPRPDGSVVIKLDTAGNTPLRTLTEWPTNTPSMMRVQLLQLSSGDFRLSDFDGRSQDNANAVTKFFYPTVGQVGDAANTVQLTNADSPQLVDCNEAFSTISGGGGYACTVTLQLPLPIGGTISDRVAYLRLTAPYNANTDFSVTMKDDANVVLFGGVQPEVDSTGRANDLFRRVKSRVEASGNGMPYIEGALDITGDLCKTLTVGDNENDYRAGNCVP